MENDKQKNIKFVCISDTHGLNSRVNLPEGDVLIHTGDFSNLGLEKEIIEFNSWLKEQKFKHKIIIAGNHEITFDEENRETLFNNFNFNNNEFKSSKEIKQILENCIYLENSGVELFGYNIWGSPNTPSYHDWAFMGDNDYLDKKWQMIPNNTDILLTHGPPYGILDLNYEKVNTGCPKLIKHVLERIKPKYHIFGHIHEAYGTFYFNETDTTFINASTCNFKYKPINKPIIFEMPNKSQ